MSGTLPKKAMSGFTMVELVSVMLIVAILVSIAVPSFKYVTSSNRIASEVNGLLGDMQYARSEAVKEGAPVTVCMSTDGNTCATGVANWQTGWIVFSDANGDHTVNNGDPLLRAQKSFASVSGSTDQFIPDNAAFKWATFNREGFATTGLTGTVTLRLNDATGNTAWKRCLAITVVGAMTTQMNGTGNC
jgi:type IV fimbrial biogenesis protein FimT